MKKISVLLLIACLLGAGYLFAAAYLTKSFDGQANESADPVPSSGDFGFRATYICVTNLEAANKLYVKPCESASGCAADAGDATCGTTGCSQWIIPAGKSYCFETSGIVALSTDTATGQTANYVITASAVLSTK